MTIPSDKEAGGVGGALPAIERGSLFQMRFMAIWIAMMALILFCAIIVPRSLLPSTFLAIIPLAAFLTIAAAGEALVLMARGIDLSIPATITLASKAYSECTCARPSIAAMTGTRMFARFSRICTPSS